MPLLAKDYIITGKHAAMLDALVPKKTEENKNDIFIFEYYWQIYVVAPIVGLIYKRKSEIDRSTDDSHTIFLGQLTPRAEKIHFAYKLILLHDENYEPNPEERIKKAFATIDTEAAQPDEQLFNSYLLGGIEILHEKLIEKSKDFISNIGGILEELSIGDSSMAEELGINL